MTSEARLWLIRHAPVHGPRGVIHDIDAPADLRDPDPVAVHEPEGVRRLARRHVAPVQVLLRLPRDRLLVRQLPEVPHRHEREIVPQRGLEPPLPRDEDEGALTGRPLAPDPDRRVDLTPLLTHTFPLDQIADGYRIFGERLEGVHKVAIRP